MIKRERIKINSIDDFKNALKKEGYDINEYNEEKFKEEVTRTFQIDDRVTERLHIDLEDTAITYKANDVKGFVDYIEKIILFEKEHNKLCNKIRNLKRLNIDRVEYEREPSSQDNVEGIIKIIEEIKNKIAIPITEEEKTKLKKLEKELDKDYIYAKDIELLKKMVITKNEDVKETYNTETKIKRISIEIPKYINHRYIKPQKGSVEYHQHLNSNIPRMQRLTKNISKYIKVCKKEKETFSIDQSEALQDTINIAVAIYDNKEFKAISGKNNISGYCTAPSKESAVFKSCKVNKLGDLGVGYNRVNDSEKKIFEEIHKQIETKILKDEGELILYSKWEPCPSCYYVISQFCEKYPNIKVYVKYDKKYGEQ